MFYRKPAETVGLSQGRTILQAEKDEPYKGTSMDLGPLCFMEGKQEVASKRHSSKRSLTSERNY